MQDNTNPTVNNPPFRRYDVRAITTLGFASVISILLISIVAGYHTTHRHNELLSLHIDAVGSKTVLAYTMREAIRERIDSLHSMAAQTDAFDLNDEKVRFFGSASKYSRARQALVDKLSTARERQVIEQLDSDVGQIGNSNTRTLAALFDGKVSRTELDDAIQASVDGHLSLLDSLDEMVRTIHHTAQDRIQQAGNKFHEAVLATTLAAIIAFAVAVGIAIFVISRASRRNGPLSHQASHDLLTGLLNRQAFEAALGLTLEQCELAEDNHALMFINLDRFKLVNDSCGHRAGDALLERLTERLAGSIRQSDVLGRIGGDEFGLLLRFTSAKDAEAVAEKIRLTVEDFSFNWENQIFKVGASIGMVCFGSEPTSLEDLLNAADVCCYSAKEEGRNRVHQSDINPEAMRRRSGEMRWVNRISDAIQNDRFVLYGQMIKPIKSNLNDGRLALEVLLRMTDLDGLGLIPPGQFLPAAERYGIVPDIDRWVVRHSLQWLAELGPTAEQVRISINICGPTASDPQFHTFVRDQIAETGVPPTSLCFEITESSAISSLDNAAALVNALGDLGCQFALDDFGSGLSSFNQLRYLKVDYLKIDGSFIHNIDRDPINRAMVESINAIGQKLGKRTVAEFVENDRIRKILQEINVDYAQGFGLHRPEPLSNIKDHVLHTHETTSLSQSIVA